MTNIDLWITRLIILLSFMTAAITLWRLMRAGKKLEEVHIMVNSRYSDLNSRVDQLVEVLKGHDIDIPVDPKDHQ
jgi:hypothetical protein